MRGAQLPLAVQLRDTASFDSYFIGPNTEAVAALRELREPILIYGSAGSGRTHLLQAACRLHGGAYLPLAALRDIGPAALDGYASPHAVFIDDADCVGMERTWCWALLRLLDRLRSEGRRFALAACATPDRLDLAVPDLRTRLAQCAVIGLRPLDDAQRAELLRLRARQRGLDLPDEVTRWLLRTWPRDTGSLLAALDILDRGTLTAKRRLTLPLAQSLLGSASAHKAPDR
ncbi:regulatory inactivation of DnaA Hda protein [Fontimonas thermophila]|uniref:Regulatory inactivation of DnaA Hda protein n=1 Tax=Fontimonas thermophila TaxID=1076937 RepID=A0A1I2IS39_9GAMM|nr:DnaA regulatory inactivator Hda [Fontimonas thermophila]SFF43331.1 regulatory inactivation of DnaA Hda protein [Fontimonas thermophila]